MMRLSKTGFFYFFLIEEILGGEVYELEREGGRGGLCGVRWSNLSLFMEK